MIASSKLPTVFQGCMWNDGWEFDAPCVIYWPHRYRCYKPSNNTGGLDSLVDDILFEIEEGNKPSDGGLERESEWRGWGKRFDKRRNAWHVRFRVRWKEEYGVLRAEVVKRTEKWGPFA